MISALFLLGASLSPGLSAAAMPVTLSEPAATLEWAARCHDSGAFARGVQTIFEDALAETRLPREIVVLSPGEAVSFAMESYLDGRRAAGYSVDVHDLPSILGDGPWTPHDIRGWLVEHYLDGGLRYLILAGDVESIPMLSTHSFDGGKTKTDYYYADLEGDWDANRNGIWGEGFGDEIDWIPEFIHARIPSADPAEILGVLQRSEEFAAAAGKHLSHDLLLAGTIAIPGESGMFQNMVSGLLLGEGVTTTRHYDTSMFHLGKLWVPLFPDRVYRRMSIVEGWNRTDCRMVYDVSHGNSRGISGCDFSELSELDAKYPAAFVAAACATSTPLGSRHNFSEELMLVHGHPLIVGSTDVVYPNLAWHVSPGMFSESIFPLLANVPGMPFGYALHVTKRLYYQLFMSRMQAEGPINTGAQNLKGFTLYGDPTLQLR